jgi:alpha-1,2-mannosyltransferase
VADLTTRGRVLIAVSALYAVAAIPIGIHKGVDLEIHFRLAERLLTRQPLYSEAASIGVWWPPFAGVALAPFALLARASLPVAKAAYTLFGIACIVWSVARFGRAARTHLALAVAAVAVPLEINFEYLNLNAVLLALIVAAGFDLAERRDGRAGVWLAVATALKVFPGLLILYAAARRRWRAAAWGAGLAVGLNALALLPLGLPGAIDSGRTWLERSTAGAWVVHRRNQSLPASLDRLGVPHQAAVALGLLLVALATLALSRSRSDDDVVDEVGIVALLAVVVSPIAWDHYFLLALPAWVAALSRAPEDRTRGARLALLVAGIATSGMLAVWSGAVRGMLLERSVLGWGALVLLLVLLVERLRRPAELPQPA